MKPIQPSQVALSHSNYRSNNKRTLKTSVVTKSVWFTFYAMTQLRTKKSSSKSYRNTLKSSSISKSWIKLDNSSQICLRIKHHRNLYLSNKIISIPRDYSDRSSASWTISHSQAISQRKSKKSCMSPRSIRISAEKINKISRKRSIAVVVLFFVFKRQNMLWFYV